MKDLPASSLKKGYVSLGPVCNNMDEQEGDDIDLSDICEVVISLKCKKCDFLCNDKATLAQHIKQVHIQNSRASSNGTSIKIISSSNGKQIQKESQSEGKTNSKAPLATEPERKDKKVKAQTSSSSSTYNKQHAEKYSKQSKSNSKNSPVVTVDNVQEEDNAGDESVEDVFLCAECDIVFSSRETCCSHMHKVHGLKQFSADFIQEEIISKPSEEAKSAKKRKTQMPRKFTQDAGAVVPNKYRVTKDVFHSCTKCTIKFESVEVMKFHEKCHLTASSKHEAAELTNNIVMPKGFICPVCESNGNDEGQQLFPRWGNCAWHLWKEHRIDCELYTCSVCKQFKSHLSARVKDHEQLHSSKASYKCKTCSKTFKQLKQLRCHEKYHKDHSTKLAPVVDSRWYTPKECPICKRILSDSKCLKKHISAVHNKLKPYVCNICGHTSARKQELLLHKRQHTGEKPYKCPMCFFATGDHNSLRKHKLRHCDKRPYSCIYCDYRCIQSCAFKKHTLASHPGQEVVFLCQLCSHKSVNETHFAAHKKDHLEGRIATETDNSSERLKKGATESSAKTSASLNNDHRTSKTTVHSWSGDDDSLDIIDNGGVTIPATPPPPKFSKDTKVSVPKAKQTDPNQKKAKKKKAKKEISKSTRSSPPNELALPSTSNSTCSSSPTFPTPNNTVYSNRLTEILDSTAKPIIIVSSATSNNVNPVQVQSQPTTQSPSPQMFCPTLPSPSLPSPRYVTVSSSSSNGFATATVNSDVIQQDPESSTSEVITNPHQLIQNIQLTPLDLTDIINCNEQSNDDGMLQRLLDMSGV